jgi:hypothetical protein
MLPPRTLPALLGEGIDPRGLDVSEEDVVRLIRSMPRSGGRSSRRFRDNLARSARVPGELRRQLYALEEQLD